MAKQNRFDYVKYDSKSQLLQAQAKREFLALEHWIDMNLCDKRYCELALNELEKAYAWIGKAIRDDQIARNGTAELQEERGNE